MFQTENSELHTLKMHFSKTVTTITAIQTETAAVYGEMTSFVYKISSKINIFAKLERDQRMQKVKKGQVIQKKKNRKFAVTAFQKFTAAYTSRTSRRTVNTSMHSKINFATTVNRNTEN